MRLTRRELAAALAGGTALAQEAARAPAAPEDELRAARERVRVNSARLAEREVPLGTEPAFQFKA